MLYHCICYSLKRFRITYPKYGNKYQRKPTFQGKLNTQNGGEIFLITDSDFFSDESIACMRIVRGDIN